MSHIFRGGERSDINRFIYFVIFIFSLRSLTCKIAFQKTITHFKIIFTSSFFLFYFLFFLIGNTQPEQDWTHDFTLYSLIVGEEMPFGPRVICIIYLLFHFSVDEG